MKHATFFQSIGLLALLALVGCGGALRGATVPTPPGWPAVPIYSFGVVACGVPVASADTCPWPIVGATIRIDAADGYHAATANADGYALFTSTLPFSDLWISAPGFADARVNIQPPTIANQNVSVALTALRPFPPEAGALHVVDRHFEDQNNQVWQWRGATQFLLFARYLAVEDITPQIRWMQQRGVNVARVFGEVNWQDGFAVPLNYSRPFDRADFDQQLGAFFDQMAAAGLRVEFTVLTYADAVATQRAYVQRVYAVAAGRWNVFVEVANEPEVNQIDPVTVMRGVDRHGVLSAYGLDPERVPAPNYFQAPMLDYGTSHDIARDVAHSPRNSKDVMDAQNTVGKPVEFDEPIGVIDPQHYPTYVQRGDGLWILAATGGGVRTTDIDMIRSSAAIACLYSPGYTLHTQAGLEGRAPGADEPIQDAAAAALTDVWRFIPAITQTGSYSRPGLNWPLTWTAGDTDSSVQHAYASIVSNTAWAVVPAPSSTWPGVQPIDGWTTSEIGPVPWIVRLAR